MSETPTLKLYDTARREVVEFRPIDPKNVRMYVCGPTVYDYAHIGNARPAIVFDVLFRLLRHLYGADAVTYARNVTDVDDKINQRAFDEGRSIRDLTSQTHAQYVADLEGLGCLPPTHEPRATDHMAEMVAIIDRLIANGVAYVAEDHVLFHVPAMANMPGVPRYGAFARRTLDDMLAGARVDVAPYKKDPMDFVLWKPSRAAHEPGWPSPGGIATPGRPGWHIECSAMSMATLLAPFGGGLACEDPARNVFDIHGGGIDLVFPHHENEIAQSCCAFGTERMANIWMHNGFLQVEGQKMSKSLGNFTTIQDVLKDWPGEVARLTMLKSHYRQPIDWTVRGLEESARILEGWNAAVGEETVSSAAPDAGVVAALSDDLNTHEAIARAHYLVQSGAAPATIRATADLLGISLRGPTGWRNAWIGMKAIDAARVDALVAARLAARKAKDFAQSDRIRDELAALGVKLKDRKNPATGEIETDWEVGT